MLITFFIHMLFNTPVSMVWLWLFGLLGCLTPTDGAAFPHLLLAGLTGSFIMYLFGHIITSFHSFLAALLSATLLGWGALYLTGSITHSFELGNLIVSLFCGLAFALFRLQPGIGYNLSFSFLGVRFYLRFHG